MSARVLATAALAGAAVAVATLPAGAGPAVRLRRLTPPTAAARRRLRSAGRAAGQRPGPPGRGLRLAAAVLAATGVAAVLPSPLGPLLAVGVGVAAHLLLPPVPVAAERTAPVQAVDLPPVLDLLASCLAAGAPLRAALAVVGEAVPPPLGPLLRSAAGALVLGSPPEAALAGLRGSADLERMADVLASAVVSGTAPADQLTALAQDVRRAGQDSARAAARRAGVLVVLPLGLCFLPAFVLLGVVPVVAGVAGRVLP